MSEREIKNALIDSFFLGYQDHGIFTFAVNLNYGVSIQSFGNYCLDMYDENKKKRVGTAYGMQFIICVLQLFDIKSISELKGVPCRVDCEFDRVYRIGHFLKDKWFDPDIDLEDFKI